MYVIEIHLYLLQIHIFRYHQTAKTKHLFHFRLLLEASCNRQKFDLQSMFTFITKSTLKNHCLQLSGVCLHFKVLKCFVVSVQQFHSTHTQQNPARQPQKSFDPLLRTKPNYPLTKLLPKNHNKNKLSPHHLSLNSPNSLTPLKP